MYNPAVTVRRIDVLIRVLSGRKALLSSNCVRAYSSGGKVTIGDVSKDVKTPKKIEYVPRKYLAVEDSELKYLSQSSLRNLRWMMQKDSLGQDMFLLGRPGPSRRKVALQYLELTQREMEYVALSRDTTEADLKQRREILQSTATYFDQSAVRAAVEGRVLVLEGIEKAERNVLPVLNNLLENREMHLEDGRFLVPAARYDKLLQEHGEEELTKWRLVRVDENFRVIALGLPVPRYSGQPLDPPLRSRFQARDVATIGYGEHLRALTEEAPAVDRGKLEQLLSAAYALTSQELQQIRLPDYPVDSLRAATLILEKNPNIPVYKLIYLLYPYRTFLTKELVKNTEALLHNLNIDLSPKHNISLQGVEYTGNEAQLSVEINGAKSQFAVPCGGSKKGGERKGVVKTEFQSGLLNELLLSHSVGDFCIIGPKGCGKSLLVSQLASLLGYSIEPIVLYQDMTARDLVQQRTTLDNGDTVWRNSALVDAALKGHLAVLDGLHRIHGSTLAVLHRLVHDREWQLHDGTRLLRHDRYDDLVASGTSPQQLKESGVLRIHPAFRIVALAEPPTVGRGKHWLSPEILSLFIFHEMRNLSKVEEIFIINSLYGDISNPLHSIINLADELRQSDDATLKNLSSSLSTRQLLRIASRMAKYPTDSAYETVQRTFLAKFLPNLARRALDGACTKLNIESPAKFDVFGATEKKISCSVKNDILTIGNTSTVIYKTNALTKVPDILFYDVPQHVRLLEWLLQDFLLGNHLLLVGNQGVGKNKIADRLLQLLNRPREYIQLHRDTTVQSLTVQPTVKGGVVIYEDSPLVKAVKNGHVLVVDEADKAPTHVTCILKTLVENGEMILSDGRRIVPKDLVESSGGDASSFIPVHEDFRMIVLANRPGFPFLGNDFFAALGDLFSCHAVDNPSMESETALLYSYGPDVPRDVTRKLVEAFARLRDLADQGQITYPYSTRELVNIVKHLQKYPSEDLASAISNVFDFDRYSKETADTLLEVLHSSGLPTEGVLEGRSEQALKKLQVTIERTSGKDVSSPKYGKDDPANKPHVGGNTWAGGTGGRDTAGLGGKGGPYRLDKGHDVHQLSDAEKDDIPEHVKKAAREMNRKAFEERLKEINISEYDAKLYEQFYRAVQPQIGALRGVLAELQAKKKERQWSRHQTSGELDDAKIIEGLAGERAIYRRRSEQTPEPGAPPSRPARLRLLADVSGSMYRCPPTHTGRAAIYRRRSEQTPEPGAPPSRPARLRLLADVSGSMYRCPPTHTGRAAIYRRRSEQTPEPGAPPSRPARLRLLADVSGSMYRCPPTHTGRAAIYRRRSEQTPEPGAPPSRPARLRLLADVSGSMYRCPPTHTGRAAIYRRRSEQTPEPGAPPSRPARLRLLADVSGSMYRCPPTHTGRAASTGGARSRRRSPEPRPPGPRGCGCSQTCPAACTGARRLTRGERHLPAALGADAGARSPALPARAAAAARRRVRQHVQVPADSHGASGHLPAALGADAGARSPALPARAAAAARRRVRQHVQVPAEWFNSYDGRLERSMEAVVLLTEALKGYETRIRYDIFAHSGEEEALELVRVDRPPENEKQRLQIIRTMHAHAQFCWAGDNTLAAARRAITALAAEDSEEDSVLVILSDANLRRYGIPPERLGAILTSDARVQAHVVFIGGLGDEADSLLRRLPPGRAHVCRDVAALPRILQQTFAGSLLHAAH